MRLSTYRDPGLESAKVGPRINYGMAVRFLVLDEVDACSPFNVIDRLYAVPANPETDEIHSRLQQNLAKQITRRSLNRRTIKGDLAILNDSAARAKCVNRSDIVADEDHRSPRAGHVAHLAQAFFLEIDVAHGQDFIHEENLRLEVCGDGEGQ